MTFENYVGIDYSGAATPTKRSRAIQVYQATGQSANSEPEPVTSENGKNWCREDLFLWLSSLLQQGKRNLIAIDHAFSFPIDYFHQYDLKSWDEFLVDFNQHWPTDTPEATVEQFRNGNLRTGKSTHLRLAERWSCSAKSVFQFDVQGSVAKSTHAGLPYLLRLRNQFPDLHVWPFDGWDIPRGSSVICETFPSLFRRRYPRADRTVDAQDAYATCRWLVEMDRLDRLQNFFGPPLQPIERKQASLEGWILGVQ